MNPKIFACINIVIIAVLKNMAKNILIIDEYACKDKLSYLSYFAHHSKEIFNKKFTPTITKPLTIIKANRAVIFN